MRNAKLEGTIFYKTNLDKVDLRNIIVNSETNFSYSSMFLIQVNMEVFSIVQYENSFILKKPEDLQLQTLITNFCQLRLEVLKSKRECTICKKILPANSEIAKLKCGHIFHKKCIKQFLKTNYKCPKCNIKTNWFECIKLHENKSKPTSPSKIKVIKN